MSCLGISYRKLVDVVRVGSYGSMNHCTDSIGVETAEINYDQHNGALELLRAQRESCP